MKTYKAKVYVCMFCERHYIHQNQHIFLFEFFLHPRCEIYLKSIIKFAESLTDEELDLLVKTL